MQLLMFLLLGSVAATVQAAGSLDTAAAAAPARAPYAPSLTKRQLLPLPPPLRDATPPDAAPSPAAPPASAPPADAAADTPAPPDQPDTPPAGQPDSAPTSGQQPPTVGTSPDAASRPGGATQPRPNPSDPAPNARSPTRTGDPASPPDTKSAKANIGRTNSTTTAKTPAASSTPTAAPEESEGSSNTGAVLGGVLGGLAALVVLLALGYRWKASAGRSRKTAAAAVTESKLSPEFTLKAESPEAAAFSAAAPVPRGSLTPLMHGSALMGPSPPPNQPNAYASYGNAAASSPPNSGVLAPLRVINSTDQSRQPSVDADMGYTSGYPPSVPGPRPYPSPLSSGYQGNNPMGLQAPPGGDARGGGYAYGFADDNPRLQDSEGYHNRAPPPPMASPGYGGPRTGPFQQQQQQHYQAAGRGSYSTQGAGQMAPNHPGLSPMSQGPSYTRERPDW